MREREARALYKRQDGIGNAKLDELFVIQNKTQIPLTTIFSDTLTTQLTRIGQSSTKQTITCTPSQLTYTANSILLNQRTLLALSALMQALAVGVETAV